MFAFTCAVFFGTQTDRGYFTLASLVLMIVFSVTGGYMVSDGFSSFLHDLKKEESGQLDEDGSLSTSM
jgi:hypothetical protein